MGCARAAVLGHRGPHGRDQNPARHPLPTVTATISMGAVLSTGHGSCAHAVAKPSADGVFVLYGPPRFTDHSPISARNGHRVPDFPHCGAPGRLSVRRRRRQALTGPDRERGRPWATPSTASLRVTGSPLRTLAEPPNR